MAGANARYDGYFCWPMLPPSNTLCLFHQERTVALSISKRTTNLGYNTLIVNTKAKGFKNLTEVAWHSYTPKRGATRVRVHWIIYTGKFRFVQDFCSRKRKTWIRRITVQAGIQKDSAIQVCDQNHLSCPMSGLRLWVKSGSWFSSLGQFCQILRFRYQPQLNL